jgi:NADH-quinone oxidoreductase subunit N
MPELNEFAPLLPEILVLMLTCTILVTDLYISEQRRGMVHLLALATLVLGAIATLRLHTEGPIDSLLVLNGTFVRDQMGDVLKLFVFLVMGAVFVYARQYLRDRSMFKGEFYVLCLFGTLGMMIMISAASLLSLYLGLELLALSSYTLVALDRDNPVASEAAMKYFVLGALASGMLLYGMSMIYGATGSLDLATINAAVVNLAGDDLVLAFGLVFMVVGMAFKLGAVPFHMWVPDVYQGSSTAVTVFLGTAPKLAAFAMFVRVLDGGLSGLHEHWQSMLVVLAVASLAIGNVVAIAQTNLKRMLAYSTISHVGFLLLGILAGTREGYEAAMFYAIVYAIMSAGAFGMIIVLSRQGFEAEELDDFKGLNQRSPWYAFMMLLIIASLAGFPPLVGFLAKLQVLKAAVGADMVWLAVVAVVFAIVGAFYYLRIIKLMYMEDAEVDDPIRPPVDLAAVLSANGMVQLLLGIFPGPLIALCAAAF